MKVAATVIMCFILVLGPSWGIVYALAKYSCAQKAEMEGYNQTRLVMFKCYASNDRSKWYRLWT